MKFILAIALLFLSFLGLMFLGIDIDNKFKDTKIISHTLLAYYFGAAIICGIVIGIASTVIMINL